MTALRNDFAVITLVVGELCPVRLVGPLPLIGDRDHYPISELPPTGILVYRHEGGDDVEVPAELFFTKASVGAS